MSNDIRPLGKFEASCPQCAEKLGVKRGTVKVTDETRILCPVHGDQGSYKQFRAMVVDQNRDEIIAKAREIAVKAAKDAFKRR